MTSPEIFVGVDVQVRRGCPWYAISADGRHIESGWLPSRDRAPERLADVVARLSAGAPARVAVGIDAPRMPLPARREWSWSGKRGAWSRTASAVGVGRHCEVVIAAQRLANPQWTPQIENAPEWMRLGFALFARVADFSHVHEVFPSAAYRQLAMDDTAQLCINFAAFLPGPKDMLDAALGALVVRDYLAGRGCAVGGGDGLGTIILPRPLSATHPLLHTWPSSHHAPS